jgi:hypothetical protein
VCGVCGVCGVCWGDTGFLQLCTQQLLSAGSGQVLHSRRLAGSDLGSSMWPARRRMWSAGQLQ